MRVITNRRLVEFSRTHAEAAIPLQAWRRLIEAGQFNGFNELKSVFGSVDVVGDKYVFNIRGNHVRLICGISFPAQICFIKAVLTHRDYDRGNWK